MAALAIQQQPMLIRLPNGQLVPSNGALAPTGNTPIAAALPQDGSGAPAIAAAADGAVAPAAGAIPSNVVPMAAGRGGVAPSPAAVPQLPQAPQPADPTAGVDIGALMQTIAAGSPAAASPPAAAAPAAASSGMFDHLKSFFLGSSTPPAPGGAAPAAEPPGLFDRLQSDPLAMAMFTGGLSTMSAASRPGATVGGALGEGLLGGVNSVVTQREAARRAAADAAKAADEHALNAANVGHLNAETGAIPMKAADEHANSLATAGHLNAETAAIPVTTHNDTIRANADAERASLGRWSPPSPGVGKDPATGKDVNGSYVTNLQTGESVFHPGVVLTGKPGGPAITATQYKHDAWLAVHPGDEQGALDYAGGHRAMTAADASKSAYNIATQELRGMAIPPKDTSAWLDKRAADIAGHLGGPAPKPAAPPKPTGALPLPPAQARVPGKTKFTGPDGRTFTWSTAGWVENK